jgi:uncharacterized protein (DUF885 family)
MVESDRLSSAAPSADERLDELAARYWKWQCHEEPARAIQAGVPTDDATLFRESPADLARRVRGAGELLAELTVVPEPEVGALRWVTYQLLRWELDGSCALGRVKAHERPQIFPFGADMQASYIAELTTIGTVEAATLYVERLATLPAYVADFIDTLKTGQSAGHRHPRVVVERAIEAVRGTLSVPAASLPWHGPFTRSALRKEQFAVQATAAQRLIEGEIVPALQRYIEYLDQRLLPASRDSLACTDSPNGDAYYAALVRFHTTTDLSPVAIHELGLAEVERLLGELNQVAAEAGFAGDLSGYRQFLANEPRFIAASKEDLRAQIEILSKRIDGRLPSFFGHLPRMTYGVESIPEALAAALPPAYAQPNPGDRGRAGIHWITSLPARCPSFMHIPLALHEAWPGHLMHLALIQEMADVPAFRRYGGTSYTACLEGWALYCEGLGVDMGLYVTPEQHFGRLQMEMWRALRLVVDTGLHTRGWTRIQAIETMAADLALPHPTIEAEVDRYIGMPGQALAYQIGVLKIRELRERAERALGSRFDIRQFHDAVMAAGPVTLPMLDRLIDRFIDGQRPQQALFRHTVPAAATVQAGRSQ